MRERFSTKLGAHSRRTAHWMNALGLVSLLAVLVGCAGSSLAGVPSPTPTDIPTATPSATATSTPTPIPNLDQRIDAYIATLTPAQQIGQTLMLAVYANGYNANLDQALTQWHLGSAIIFPNYNGGPLMPTTLAGMQQLIHDLQAHADTPLLLATDEEGGSVDRLSFYYGPTPSPQAAGRDRRSAPGLRPGADRRPAHARPRPQCGLRAAGRCLSGRWHRAEPHLRRDARTSHDLRRSLPRRPTAERRRRDAEALARAGRLHRQSRLHAADRQPYQGAAQRD